MPKHLSFFLSFCFCHFVAVTAGHLQKTQSQHSRTHNVFSSFSHPVSLFLSLFLCIYRQIHSLYALSVCHLEQKHTHLHIDFVNVLFIYLFLLVLALLSLSFIQAHITRIRTRFFSSVHFSFMRSNRTIRRSHIRIDGIYDDNDDDDDDYGDENDKETNDDQWKLYHVLADCQLSIGCLCWCGLVCFGSFPNTIHL